MGISAYKFEYKSPSGVLEPITIAQWAEETLTGNELDACKLALARQEQFKSDLALFCKEYTDYTKNDLTQLYNPERYIDIPEHVIYRLYNITSVIIQYELNKAANAFGVDMSTIDEQLMARYLHNMRARALNKHLLWYIGSAPAGDPDTIVYTLLRFNGSNQVELGLDLTYPGMFDTVLNVPDPDWEKYWDLFLSDPNVVVVN